MGSLFRQFCFAILFSILFSVGYFCSSYADCSFPLQLVNTDATMTKFQIISSNGYQVGHIEKHENLGTWSVWIEHQGALNEMFTTKEGAVDALCNHIQSK